MIIPLLEQLKIGFKSPNKILNFFIKKIKEYFLWDSIYYSLREPKVKSSLNFNPQIYLKVKKQLIQNGFDVLDYYIDIHDYILFLKMAQYTRYPKYLSHGKSVNLIEKSLEHYLASKFLNLTKNDIYIDIANANSPAPEIYNRLFGCKIYRQDLCFPIGIHGNRIGGDASHMPIMKGFATKMALHCSFEHFEQDSDKNFIIEANRVLKKGGKLCIVPLYLFTKYVIQTDPAVLPRRGIPFENDAILYCAKDFGNRHGRFYDVVHFINRIKNNLKDLKLTIFCVQNEKKVDPSCYVKFIALFEKN